MKAKILRNSIVAGLLAAAAGYSMQASALPLEPFSFTQHSGFLVDPGFLTSTAGNNDINWYDQGNTPGSPISPFSTPTYNTIAWGVPATTSGGGAIGFDPFAVTGDFNQVYSGLRVIGHEGTVTTGADLGFGNSDWGSWQSISTIYHRNQAISATAATLTSAVVYSELVFNHTPGGTFTPGGSNFTSADGIPFSFTETLNQAPCSSDHTQLSTCDDKFGFPNVNFAPVGFMFDGHFYSVEFALGNFVNSLTDFPVCGGGPECSVWTAENTTSSLDVIARIREIPEPSTLALMGLTLLGLAGLRRRNG